MSSLIVEVSKIERVLPHSNAERLELAHIKGWQCVVPKGRYAAGQLVTYVPPDCVLPEPLSDRLGVTKYLSKGRVRCARLRGEPSFGLVIDLEDAAWDEGRDVAVHYGITKFVPPIRTNSGDAEVAHPLFASYTEIENMRNFPDAFVDGEQVVATEKIHGTNCRVGIVTDEDGRSIPMAGSKLVRRKQPDADASASNLYWFPWTLAPVAQLLRSLADEHRQVILFGEVYGRVQSLRYGLPNGIAFRAFDLLVDGKYVDHDAFVDRCALAGVETVPLIYRGPFSVETIRLLSDGRSTLPGADNIREGVVVKPIVERTDPKLGRAILKYVGDTYLFGDVSDSQEE